MLLHYLLRNLIALTATLCCAAGCYGQTATAVGAETQAAPSAAVAEKTGKNIVPAATLNLQSTITGNQEQPRVLYILPWQSPAPEDVDFEALDNQQKAAFSHIEREELRRELEFANE